MTYKVILEDLQKQEIALTQQIQTILKTIATLKDQHYEMDEDLYKLKNAIEFFTKKVNQK